MVQWLLPEWKVSKWLTLFTQPWEGDVTFTLPSMLWNLRKTIINPSTTELMLATQASLARLPRLPPHCALAPVASRTHSGGGPRTTSTSSRLLSPAVLTRGALQFAGGRARHVGAHGRHRVQLHH